MRRLTPGQIEGLCRFPACRVAVKGFLSCVHELRGAEHWYAEAETWAPIRGWSRVTLRAIMEGITIMFKEAA